MMNKILTTISALIIYTGNCFAAEPINGVWKTIDDETNEPKSLVRIYEYEGKYYGRVIKLFKNPDTIATGVKGNKKIDGLDIIWNMQDDGEKFKGGKILDPKKGKIYTCEIWKDEKGELIVRGKIGPFGRNQKWIMEDIADEMPKIIPAIPELED